MRFRSASARTLARARRRAFEADEAADQPIVATVCRSRGAARKKRVQAVLGLGGNPGRVNAEGAQARRTDGDQKSRDRLPAAVQIFEARGDQITAGQFVPCHPEIVPMLAVQWQAGRDQKR
jgi:hypothetical protein